MVNMNAPTPALATPPKKKSDRLAWTCTLGSALLCLLAFMGLSSWAERNFGPQVASVSPSAVWTYSQSTLWRLNHEGKVTGKYSAGSLGIGPSVEMLAALSDSEVALRDFRSKSWQVCGVRDADVVHSPCRPLFASRESSNRSRAAIAVMPGGERWVFADFDHGEVLLLDKKHNVVATARGPVGSEGGVAVWLPGQVLALMATDQPRLQLIDWKDEARPAVSSGWALKSGEKQGQGYVWSAAFDEVRKRWLLSYGSVRRATHYLWLVDDRGVKVGGLNLGGKGEPAQVVIVAKDMAIVPDVVLGKVHRIDLATDSVSEFGDESFRTALRKGQQIYDLLDLAAQGAMFGMFLLPLLVGLIFVDKDNKRTKFIPGSAPVPATLQGEFWFTMNPDWIALQMRMIWVAPIVVIAMLGASGYLLWQFTGSWIAAGVIIALGAVVSGVTGIYYHRQIRLHGFGKLGINATGVIRVDGRGRRHDHAFADVLTDGQRMLLGKQLVLLNAPISPGPWLVDELNEHLLPRLPQSSWVSKLKFEGQLYRRNRVYAAAIIIATVTFLALQFGLPAYLKAKHGGEGPKAQSAESRQQ